MACLRACVTWSLAMYSQVEYNPVAVQGDLEAAIEHYHKALGLRPEDTFTTEMLTVALIEAAKAEDAAAL